MNPHIGGEGVPRLLRRPGGPTPLELASDPTSKQDDLVALVISVVYRKRAIPVAWHIVETQEWESWIDQFCRLLRQLAPAVPVHGRSLLYGDCRTLLPALPYLVCPDWGCWPVA